MSTIPYLYLSNHLFAVTHLHAPLKNALELIDYDINLKTLRKRSIAN